MGRKVATKTKERFWNRHRHLKHFFICLAIFILLIVIWVSIGNARSSARQNKLQPFYNTAGLPKQGPLGQVVRQEPLGVNLDGGHGVRVLYRTQRADGSYTFSSGMILIPDNTNAGSPRPVVAWAHGTLGLGDACAPTRASDPVGNIAWVSSMLKKGWVVAATDYAGFGTPGTQGYLVGGDEAHDVLNSVRAARDIQQAKASNNFVIWGHSQGGNSALFSASEAATYAPDLHLTATVASAPAAELIPLLNEQYGTPADWIIGPLVATSWPAANKSLHDTDLLTTRGLGNYHKIADQCIEKATIGGLIRSVMGQKFFSANPIDLPTWRNMAQAQSAPLLASGQPLMVVESKADKVVLPNTTALYIQTACKTDTNLTTLWLDKTSHQDIPDVSANQVIGWISDRFADQLVNSDCSMPLPFAPATIPK